MNTTYSASPSSATTTATFLSPTDTKTWTGNLILSIPQNKTVGNETTQCFDQTPVDFARLLIIVGFGCPIAFLGVVSNCILIRFFLGDASRRHSPYLYLGVLAIVDTLTCLFYILIFGVDALAIYKNLGFLWFLWTHYSLIFYGCVRITEVACPYVIIAATIERYILSSHHQPNFLKALTSNRSRRCVIGGILCLAILIRGVMLVTLKRVYKENCPDYLSSYTVENTEITETAAFTHYSIYVMPVIQTFFPVCIMFLLNFLIIRNLRHRYSMKFREMRGDSADDGRGSFPPSTANCSNYALKPPKSKDVSLDFFSQNMEDALENPERFKLLASPRNNVFVSADPKTPAIEPNFQLDMVEVSHELANIATTTLDIFHYKKHVEVELREEKARIRSLTITLVAIVTSYLIFSSFGLFIAILEQIPGNKLLFGEHGHGTDFYTISSDLISFLVVVQSFIRIFIYLATDKQLRNDLKQCCTC